MDISSVVQLNSEDKNKMVEKGYLIQEIFGSSHCSVLYNCQYLKDKENEDDEPQRLFCKVMEIVNAPRDFAKKFLPRELAILQRIRSAQVPNINHVFSIIQIKTKIMVFSRYAGYGNLGDYIISHYEDMDENLIRKWFWQIALSLVHLHTINIVHRDIKCENILLTDSFDAKLCEFGFSRLSVDKKGERIYSSTYCGSINYAAPEILKGVPYNPKLTDVWSLGVVLFTMLNGKMPFPQTSIQQIHKAQTQKDFKFRKSVQAKVSYDVIGLVKHMLEPRWIERISSKEILYSPWFYEFNSSLGRSEKIYICNVDILKRLRLPSMNEIFTKNLKLSEAVDITLPEESEESKTDLFSDEITILK